ncbi:MAG: hypothetical protein QOD77_224 [Thermoplasmata archaeon]|jgi:hypothetical protein|nr:hypothetical protein [Thermoplasmata archaeon]
MTTTTHGPARGRLLLLGLGAAALVAVLAAAAPHANASAIIDNGVVQLGVDDYGQLNIPGPPSSGGVAVVGLRFMPTNGESTSPGCLCEGWGVSYDNTVEGFADNAMGGPNGCIAPVSFTSTATTAVSVVDVCDLRVTHDFHPSPATPNLYEVDVSIENRGTVAHGDVLYRRAMDWDVEPTAFSEYSTIDFVGPTPPVELVQSSNNGFAVPSPLSTMGGTPGPFTDLGPTDHGAAFDFSFGSVLPGMTVQFRAYYGAAQDEATADSARIAAGVQLWSYGQCNKAIDPACDETTGTPNTFIFGFGALTPSRCDQVAKTGRAFIAHAHNWDVGNTGYLGPADTWVVDSGDMFTYAPMALDATTATYSGPLMDADVLFARTTAQACASTARTAVAHLVSGPAAPVPFEVKLGEVVSSSDCRGHSGSTTLAYLMVNSVVLIDTTNQPPPNTKILLGPVTVTLNEHRVSPGVLEVNAVHIEVPGVADVRVLSARSDIHGCGRSIPEACGLTVGIDAALKPVAETCWPPCDLRTLNAQALPCQPCVGGLAGILECACQPIGAGIPTDGGIGGGTGADPKLCCQALTPIDGLDTTIGGPGVPGPCLPCRTILPGTHALPPLTLTTTRNVVTSDCPCPAVLGVDLDPAVPSGRAYASLDCGPCRVNAIEDLDGSVPAQRGTGTVLCDPCPLLPPNVAAAIPCRPCRLTFGHDERVAPPSAFAFADLDCMPCLVRAQEMLDGTTPWQHGDGSVECDPCELLPPTIAAMLPCMPCRITYLHDEGVSPTATATVTFDCGPCRVTSGLKLDALTLTEFLFGDVQCHGCLVSGMSPVPDVCVGCDVHADEDGVTPALPPATVATVTLSTACTHCVGSPCIVPACPPVDPADPCGLGPVPPPPPPSTLPVVGPVLAPLDPVVQAVLDLLGL